MSMRAYRPSEFPPGPPLKRKRLKAIDIPCPFCKAAAGVPCPTAGTHHAERIEAWRLVKGKKAGGKPDV